MNNLAFQIYGSKKTGIFQSTWDTTKTSTGSSATNQITLPLISGGTYNFWIDWGDGSTTNVTSYSQRTHTYASAGTYTIRATGTVGIWRFANGGDKLKILTVSSWGKLILGASTFQGCYNLTLSGITDVPDLTTVTSLVATFASCPLITTIGRIDEWNMTSITSTASMFNNASLFNQSLSSWERTGSTLSNVTEMSTMFYRATVFNGNLNGWNLSKVTAFNGMFQEAPAFNNGAVAGAGGTMPWTINTTTSVRMDSMFYNHYSFNQDIGSWNVSKVTSFASFLYHDNGSQANTFNNGYSDSIKNWNVGSCTDFTSMFVRCRFNQPIHLWDVSKATSMDNMFFGCGSFNNGFASGIPNQLPWNINTLSNVSMSSMFSACASFNSNLGTGTTPWDVSKVTTFAGMFQGATNFRNGDDTAPINNWSINTVSNVSMASMFQSASNFNRDVSNWNMTKVVNTSSMFYFARDFNQPLANWERIGSTLANVTSMNNMFQNATAFNQPIGNWNVSNVSNFINFMNGKTSGNFSSTNLDAIYNGWIVNGVQPNINISFGTAKYTAAGVAGRLTLTSAPNNWIIQDGGL